MHERTYIRNSSGIRTYPVASLAPSLHPRQGGGQCLGGGHISSTPEGVAAGVVAKNLAEQKLSSVLGQSELNASASSSPCFLFSFLLRVFLGLLRKLRKKRRKMGNRGPRERGELVFIRFSDVCLWQRLMRETKPP